MTTQRVKETTQNVVIPVSVALGLIALTAKALGVLPGIDVSAGLANRVTAVEARQVEMERQWREDRNEMMRVLYTIQGDVRRIEGKMEK